MSTSSYSYREVPNPSANWVPCSLQRPLRKQLSKELPRKNHEEGRGKHLEYLTGLNPNFTTSTSYILESKEEEFDSFLDKYKIIGNSKDVIAFIDQDLNLSEVLSEAPDKIKEYFEAPDIFLELNSDPEFEKETLFIVIGYPSSMDPEEAVTHETNLLENWFVHVMPKLNGKLVLTIDPV